MELPRKILIGDGVITQLDSFISSVSNASRVALISGNIVRSTAGRICDDNLADSALVYSWFIAENAGINFVSKLKVDVAGFSPDFIIGIGGGRSVDVAKMIAFDLNIPFMSVPTSASHDGISSPFVSIRGNDKPYSMKANTPVGVLADTGLISKAPRRLLASGCGDLVAKVTAVRDWELARDEKGEYYGSYAANLASMSANIILKESERLKNKSDFGIRTIVEALISAGVASCIAGSSRPCSGSEHLFSHALEYVKGYNCGLHGERVGLGTIIMAKLHEIDWELIVHTLRNIGAPTRAREINLSEDDVVSALMIAQSLRPERYTILSKVKLTKEFARDLVRTVRII